MRCCYWNPDTSLDDTDQYEVVWGIDSVIFAELLDPSGNLVRFIENGERWIDPLYSCDWSSVLSQQDVKLLFCASRGQTEDERIRNMRPVEYELRVGA